MVRCYMLQTTKRKYLFRRLPGGNKGLGPFTVMYDYKCKHTKEGKFRCVLFLVKFNRHYVLNFDLSQLDFWSGILYTDEWHEDQYFRWEFFFFFFIKELHKCGVLYSEKGVCNYYVGRTFWYFPKNSEKSELVDGSVSKVKYKKKKKKKKKR